MLKSQFEIETETHGSQKNYTGYSEKVSLFNKLVFYKRVWCRFGPTISNSKIKPVNQYLNITAFPEQSI